VVSETVVEHLSTDVVASSLSLSGNGQKCQRRGKDQFFHDLGVFEVLSGLKTIDIVAFETTEIDLNGG
jgi:hypothetical protein